ncbi:unnamed protein product [Cladocopium goreaui]|nr:unnamed protein product [Cladocopium goreaui]
MSRSMMETNSIHFNAAIAAAELHGEWQTALQLLRRMLAEKVDINVISFNRTLGSAGQASCWTLSLALLEELPTHQLVPDSFSYSAVIKGLKQGLLWQLALALFNHMPRGLRDKVCYNSAIASMPWNWALELFHEMTRSQTSLDAVSYGSAVAACQRAAQWQSSLILLMEVRQNQLSNAVIENTVMGSCARANQRQITLNLLDEMEARNVSDHRSYGIAMTAFNDGAWEACLDLLVRSLRASTHPNVVSCTTLIRTCATAGEWRMALEVLRSMAEMLVEANTWSYNSSITACESASHWEVALLQLHQMRAAELEPDVISFNSTLSAFQDGTSWSVALQVLEQMEQSHLEPDTLTFNSTITACRHWPTALAVLQAMFTRNLLVSAISFGAVINECETDGEWEVALGLLHHMLGMSHQPDGRILGSVVNCLRTKDGFAALELFSSLPIWVKNAAPVTADLPDMEVLACGPGILTLCKPSMQRTEDLVARVAEVYPHVTVVSRLDSPTSGVLPVILAEDGSNVAKCFQAQFAGRLVHKDYVCLCEGSSLGAAGTAGEVQAPLRTFGDGQSVRSEVSELGKAAKTEYWVRARYLHPGATGELILLHVKPLTGRTHQIREHGQSTVAAPRCAFRKFGKAFGGGCSVRKWERGTFHASLPTLPAPRFARCSGSFCRQGASALGAQRTVAAAATH